MATGGSLYWSIRRRVRRNLEEHFSEIESLSRHDIEETLSNSSQQQTSNTQLSHVDDNVNRVDQDPENSDLGELSENEDRNSNDHDDFENNMGTIASDSSDKDSESESENNQHDQESFKEDLRNWAVTHQVPNSTISDLLSILRKQHPYLPKDPRTLLKTKVNDAVVNKCGGQYYHFGMSSALSQQLETHSSSESLRDQFYVKIQINIDGLPSFKSASDQFWSILGMIANLELKKPFVIGLYHGIAKPDTVDQYLEDFVNEYLDIQRNGNQYSG